MNIDLAKKKLEQLRSKPKFETMIRVAAIITGLLEQYKIKPIIVGR